MRVESAITAATEWVIQHAIKEEGFQGAYFSGSTIGMPRDAELSPSSDVDIVIVTNAEEPPLKLGKFFYQGVLLEVTYLSWNQLSSAEEVLTSYHLAGSFRVNTIIADPTGRLRSLQSKVSRHFADKQWVRCRCENVMKKIENGLRSIDTSVPYYDLVTSWLFPTGITTHVILVAALRNPTVRRRYAAAREVLTEYGQSDFYQELIELLGCGHMTPQRVEEHLDQLAITFDTAADVAKTPFFFSTDITIQARPIAIDGSRELIRCGLHREAVFWIAATFARCHKILASDAPSEIQRALIPAFENLVADLGITSNQDFIDRAENALRFLPRLWEITEEILLKNPSIVKG
jgi:hypothetical protein